MKIHAVQISIYSNENVVALAKKHAGRNGNLLINFAWPKIKYKACGRDGNIERGEAEGKAMIYGTL